MAAGGVAASGVLARRRAWEPTHNRVAICVDGEDVAAAALRANVELDELLHELAHHGATHVSLPELTLHRLLRTGELVAVGAADTVAAPRWGHWNQLRGQPALVAQLAAELQARLPHTQATGEAGWLRFAGDLPTVGELGLGFEATLALRINRAGLECVPRPVSYAWPADPLIELSLAQAAVFGKLVAFEGDMVLGHEMHLETTLAAMHRAGLTFVYFAESRHQKGDWFVAKRRAPQVVLAHRFTPAAMVPLDFHAAAHQWAWLARERGIRLCYVNFFRVLHATEPLEGLHYIEHIREALEHDGFVVSQDVTLPTPMPQPTSQELTLGGVAVAGMAAAAVNSALNLPEALALPLTVGAAGSVALLPYLDVARGSLEEKYTPSYTPKALALASAVLAPVLAAQAARRQSVGHWWLSVLAQPVAAATMATATSGPDYYLRIEEYKGFNLDWAVPLATAALTLPPGRARAVGLALVAGAWAWANQRGLDPLARVDPSHAEGHTHHLSAAARFTGDVKLALGPQPARKWAGLGPVASALSLVFARRGNSDLATLTALAGAVGSALGLVGFRRPERALSITLKETWPSYASGILLGWITLGLRPRVRGK